MTRASTPTTRKSNGRQAASLPRWLTYLVNAYPTAKPSGGTLAIYDDQFSKVDGGLMLQVARRWVAESTWWPQPAELWPLVKEEGGAQLDREPDLKDLRALHGSRMAKVRALIKHDDDELLAYEIEQGRVANPEALEEDAQPAIDERRLAEVQEAYKRAAATQAAWAAQEEEPRDQRGAREDSS